MINFLLPVTVLDTICFRFFFCLSVLYLVLRRFLFEDVFFSVYPQNLLFNVPGISLSTQITAMNSFLIVGLLLAMFNFYPRTSLLLTAMGYVNLRFLISNKLGLHGDSLVPLVLVLLASTPKIPTSRGQILSPEYLLSEVNPLSFWSIKSYLSCVYLSTFVSKLVNTGFSWASGIHLQNYLFERFVITNNFYALWLSGHPTICQILSLLALFTEGCFWILLFIPKIEKFFVLLGLGMHFFILTCFDINFFPGFVITYFVFVPYSEIYKYFKRILA